MNWCDQAPEHSSSSSSPPESSSSGRRPRCWFYLSARETALLPRLFAQGRAEEVYINEPSIMRKNGSLMAVNPLARRARAFVSADFLGSFSSRHARSRGRDSARLFAPETSSQLSRWIAIDYTRSSCEPIPRVTSEQHRLYRSLFSRYAPAV